MVGEGGEADPAGGKEGGRIGVQTRKKILSAESANRRISERGGGDKVH